MSETATSRPLAITDVVLRDAHQSLLATRMRIEDMLPIAPQLDELGLWAVESWGGATFDSCIRYLGEDPWERIRKLKAAMPKTRQQMLLRGQNLLGYRHYADDVVSCFVERAAENGVDVFRIFDALNDMRNLSTAIKAVRNLDKHAQGTISYTVSHVHNIDLWVDLGRQIQDMQADSLCIKDMAGLLKPYVAFELVSRLKEVLEIPIHMQSHATTGMSTATYLKSVEAGIDNLDTAISSMSMTYGHSATETLVAVLEGTDRDTGLDIARIEDVAAYFREVRKKYAAFEGSLRGVDSRILVAQVPGGMLTNLESQLAEQKAVHRLDEVLEEIPRVREELGVIPLVTPTSQIVGTQAVINVVTGERYKSITREVSGLLKGEYGATPAPVNGELQARVLEGGDPITCRPANLLEPELGKLSDDLRSFVVTQGIRLAENELDDVLTYALFGQIGLKFLKERDNPAAFEPPPDAMPATNAPTQSSSGAGGIERYSVRVDGRVYDVEVSPSGALKSVQPVADTPPPAKAQSTSGQAARVSRSALAGNVFKVLVNSGDRVDTGDVLLVLEAMKMETEVVCSHSGTVSEVHVSEGDKVDVDDPLVSFA